MTVHIKNRDAYRVPLRWENMDSLGCNPVLYDVYLRSSSNPGAGCCLGYNFHYHTAYLVHANILAPVAPIRRTKETHPLSYLYRISHHRSTSVILSLYYSFQTSTIHFLWGLTYGGALSVLFSGQEDVFAKIGKGAVSNVLNGYNSTVFAYGQTGSGKTFTVTGGAERCVFSTGGFFGAFKFRGDARKKNCASLIVNVVRFGISPTGS